MVGPQISGNSVRYFKGERLKSGVAAERISGVEVSAHYRGWHVLDGAGRSLHVGKLKAFWIFQCASKPSLDGGFEISREGNRRVWRRCGGGRGSHYLFFGGARRKKRRDHRKPHYFHQALHKPVASYRIAQPGATMATVQEAVRRLTVESRSVGIKETARDARDLSDAVDGVAVASRNAERATQSMESRLNSIQRKYDEQYRAQMEVARVERDLMAAQAQGLISMQRRAELLDLVTQRHGLAAAAMHKEALASRDLAAANDNMIRARRQNLTYQLFDIGQSGFGGASAAMIAAQQGPQIIQLYAGQGGVNAALKDTASLLGGVASRFGPVAIAAGVAALAIKGIQDEINETSKVQVEFMDVAKAIWQVSADAIEDELRPAIKAIAPEAESAWSGIRDAAAWEFSAVVKIVQWTYETIKFHVSSIPDLFIVAGEAAANGFVGAITWMVNAVLEGLRNIAAAMNGFIDRNGGEVLRKKLGWDAANWVPGDIDGKTFNIGGDDALERLQKRAEDYQKTIGDIVRSDPAAKLFGAIGGQAGKNAVDRMNDLAKKTRGAGSAAREAQREFEGFVRTADRLAEKMFPGDYARKEAEELTAQLDKYGDKLTDLQRVAVDSRIADQFKAARLGVRELEEDTKNAANQMAEDLQGTLGSVLGDLFTTPMDDLDEFVDRALSAFAKLGTANLERGLDGLFSGKGLSSLGAANDNDPWGGLRKAVEKGTASGAFAGSQQGTQTGLGSLLSSLTGGNGGQLLSSGLGGLGMGFESGNALTGGLGGALSGFLSGGGPLGAIIGGIGGFIGGIFGRSRQKRKERDQARAELESNMGAIRDLIDTAMGTPSGSYESAWREMSDEITKSIKLAKKAGNSDLVKELEAASQNFFDFLVKDWRTGLDGVIAAMESGHGMDSAFVRAQQGILDLQDTLTGFVEDAKFFAETGGDLDKARLTKAANDNSTTGSAFKSMYEDRSRYNDPVPQEYRVAAERYQEELTRLGIDAFKMVGPQAEQYEVAAFASVEALMKKMTDLGVVFDDLGNVLTADQVKERIEREKELQKAIAEAQDAAQQMALSQLTGAEEFTQIELAIQTLQGTAAGLQTTLEKLGMTSQEAADAIEDGLAQAMDKLRKDYIEGLKRSINDLAGNGFLNDAMDAFDLYAQRIKDGEALGLKSSLALKELTLSLEGVAREAIVSGKGLDDLLRLFPDLADDATSALRRTFHKMFDELRKEQMADVTRSLNDLSGVGYINSVTDALSRYEQRLKDSKTFGIDASLALTELTLSLRKISDEAGLSKDDLKYLAKLFPEIGSLIKGISPSGGVAEAQAAVDRAKADLRAAYDEEARAIEATIDRLKGFIESIQDFKASLRLDSQLSPLSPTDRLIEAQKRFQEISTKALGGDEAAMADLENVSRQYLTEARAYYASSEQYFAIFEQVESILDQALSSAKGQLSAQERQLSALETQVSKLIDIDNSVMTVADAVRDLKSAIKTLDKAGGDSSFDQSTYWSSSLKDFYSTLQTYKAATKTNVVPDQIAGVWSAFSSAGSAKEYDLLAKAYADILRGLMPKLGMRLGGIVGAYASGGIVGNGIYDQDSVLARYAGGGNIALAGGEFVTRAKSVNSRTSPTLDHINRTGTLPGNDNAAIVAELRALRAEVAEFRAERRKGDDIAVAGVKVVAKAVTDGTEATKDVGRKLGKQDLRRPA